MNAKLPQKPPDIEKRPEPPPAPPRPVYENDVNMRMVLRVADAAVKLVTAVKAMLTMHARAHNFPVYTPPADVVVALKELEAIMAEVKGRGG